jgi:putative inorganic carbon (HCO3(-)) transporter
MRDVLLTSVVAVLLFFVLRRPWWGVLLLAWLGYMNPHRLCFGFAARLPFFFVVFIVTAISLLCSPERKRLPCSREFVVLGGLILWMNVTLCFALNPEGAWIEWNQQMKIMLFIALCVIVLTTRQRLELMLWVIALSLGFYGLKGGLFTLLHGGTNTVVGPDASFIADNNSLAVALAMTLPLLRYLQLQTDSKYARLGVSVTMALTALAIIGTYSRAGFISLSVVALVMWWKSRRRLLLGLAVPVCALMMIGFMPDQWMRRIQSIKSYDEDPSTLGRFNAWKFAINLANDRPLVGGGFRSFTPALFQSYAPDPDNYHAAHSIYFQMLGDHGYVGLTLFIVFYGLTWLSGNWVRKHSRGRSDLVWAGDMTAMLQTSLVAYAVGGASLSLAYFDLPINLAAVIIVCKATVRTHISREQDVVADPSPELAGLTPPT